MHIFHQERSASQGCLHGKLQWCAAVERMEDAVGWRVERERQILHMRESGERSVLFCPRKDRVRVFGKRCSSGIQTKKNKVSSYRPVRKGHTYGIVVPFAAPMHNAIRR